MPKMFHDPTKNPPVFPPTYLMYGPLLTRTFLKLTKNSYFSERLLMTIILHALSSLSAYIVVQECSKVVALRLQRSSRF